ncbi:MAG: hypothetical protein BA863_12990 [Desulfovibrio sp. S3730MH75]|nr:MAG: hypothetical protein BA863_12990 [Desulfovibrio sp. S3730MH75]
MRKYIIPLMIIVFTLGAFTGCEKRRDDFYNKAVKYYDQKKFTEARLELKNALSIDPECGECRLLFGKLALEEGNFQSAFINFKYATDFAPDLLEAKVEMSKLYLLAREYDSAGDMARKVLNVDSSNIEARLVLAAVLMDGEKYVEAERNLNAALADDPENPDVYLSLSNLYYDQGQKKKAESVLADGIAKIPSNTSLLMKVSVLYREMDKPEKVQLYVEKLLKAGNEEPRFVLFAAESFSAIDNSAKAEELMSGLVSRFPDKDDYRVLYARLLVSLKKNDQAINTLKDGLLLNNESLPLRSALSGIYIAQGQQAEAIKILTAGAEIDAEGADNVAYRKKLATLYLDMNESSHALEQLDLVIERNPKDAEAHYLRGQIYLLEGKGQQAVSEFRQVLRDNPESAPGYVLLAKAHMSNDEMSIAIENLKEAISLDPGYRVARETLINAYLDRKDWQQAILELQRLKEKRPDDINISAAIGDVYAIKGDLNLAKLTFANLSKRFPKSPIGDLKLAELAEKEGNKGLVQKYYAAALKRSPDSLVAIQGMVQALLAQNKYTSAIKFCNKLLAKYPDNARIFELKGGVYGRRNDFKNAEKNYFRATELAPDWMLPYMRIGDLYVSAGKTAKGITKFSKVVKKDEANPAPRFILGLLYEQKGDFKKAREAYSAILEKDPGFQLAANNLAYLLATQFAENSADMDEALKFAKVAASSQSPESLDTLGYILYLKGEYEQALHALNTALQIVPDFSAAQFHKALVYVKRGDAVEGRKILKKLLKTQDDFPERKEALKLLSRL